MIPAAMTSLACVFLVRESKSERGSMRAFWSNSCLTKQTFSYRSLLFWMIEIEPFCLIRKYSSIINMDPEDL